MFTAFLVFITRSVRCGRLNSQAICAANNLDYLLQTNKEDCKNHLVCGRLIQSVPGGMLKQAGRT